MAVSNIYPLKTMNVTRRNERKIIFYLPEESFQIKFNGFFSFFFGFCIFFFYIKE